jgi:hypothetical protein
MIKDMMASNELHILICMLGQASHSQTKSIAIDLLLDHPSKDLDESFHFDIEKENGVQNGQMLSAIGAKLI